MGENESATGLAITIPEEVFNDLNRLEGKIKSLETTTDLASKNIVKAFQRMVSGINPLINKMGEAESLMKSMGNIDFSTGLATLGRSSSSIEKSASAIVEMANTMNRTDFSSNIENAHKRLQALIGDLKIYEEYLNTPNDANQALALEGIDKTSKEIKEIIAVIPELEKLQSVLSRNDLFQNYIDGLNGATIEARRQKSEMSQLNEYYRELEKSSARSAKEQERATAQAQKALERQRKEQEKLLAAQQKAYRETPKGAMNFAASATTYNQRAQAMKYLEAAIKNLDKTSKDYQQTLLRLSSRYKGLKDEQDAVQRSMGTLQQSQHNLMDISGQLMRRLALVFSVSQVTQYVQKLAQVRGEFELQNAALAAIMQNKDEADQLFGQITQLAVQSPFQLKELVTYTKELAAYRIENEKLYDTTKMLADVSAGLGVDMSRLILAYGQVKAANYLRGTELRQFSEAGINILGELATYFSELENRAVSVGEVFEMVSNRMVTFQDVEEIFRRITSEGGIFANMQEVQARTLAGMISNMQDSVDIMLNEIGQESEGTLKNAVRLVKELMENWRTVAAIGKSILIPLTTYLAISKTLVSLNRQYLQYERSKIAFKKLAEAWTKKEALAQAGLNVAAKANPYLLGASILIGTITGIVSLIKNATEEQRRMNQTINEGAQKAGELSANFERLANIAVADSRSTEEQTAAIEELNRTYGELIPSQYRNVKALKEMQGDYSAVTAAIYDKIDAQTREKLVQDALTEAGDDSGKWTDKIINRLQRYGISADAAMVITREFQERLKNGDYSTMNEAIIGLRDIIKDFAGEAANAAIPVGALEKPANKLFKIFSSLEKTLDKISNMEFGPFRIGGGTRVYEEYSDQLEKIVATTDEYKKRLQEDDSFTFKYSVELDEAAKDAQVKAIQDFIDQLQQKIDKGIIDEKDVASVRNVIEDAQKKIDEIKVSSITEEIQDLRVEFSKLYDLDFGELSFTEKLSTEGFDEYVKKVEKNVEELQSIIDKLDAAREAGENIPPLDLQNMLKGLSEDELRNKAAAAKAFLDAIRFDYDDKKIKKGIKDTVSIISSQIDAIKRAGQAYDEALKLYNAEESKEKIVRDYAELFDSVGIGNMIGTMEFDASGLIAAYKKLLENISDTAADEAEKKLNAAIADVSGEINVKIRTEEIGSVKELFDELMAGYNIAVQLDDTGLDKKSIAKMFGIEDTSIEDIRKRIENAWIGAANAQERVLADMYDRAAVVYTDVESAVASLGENGVKQFQTQLEEMDKALANEQKKWMNLFINFLSQSVNEIQQVQNEGITGIGFAKQFFDEGKLSAEQYGVVVKRIILDVNKQISNINLEKFKDSPEYIQAMGDLSAYSYIELERLLGKLKEIVATSAKTMDAEDMETYMNAINRIQTQMDNMKSPFMENEVAQLIRLKDLEEQFNSAQENHNHLLQEREEWLHKVANAQAELDRLQNEKQNGNQSQQMISKIAQANSDLLEATEGLSEADNAINASQSNLSSISGMIGQITNGAGSALTMVDLIIKAVYNSIKATVELFQEVKELADSFGEDTESGRWSDAGLVFDMIGNFNESAMQGWERLKSGDVLGATVSTLSSIFDIIKGINALRDNQREKIIQSETEKVEGLADAYDDLADSIDKINNAAKLDDARSQLEENIRKQVESYDKMIAAEKDKKNPDEDQIKEWEKAQEDVIKQGQDDMEALLEKAGGVAQSDYLSSSEEFVDAWLQAFRETGDGLSGLKDNFDDFFLNILTRQAALTIAQPLIDSILDEINKSLQDDSMISVEEGEAIRKKWEEIAPTLDENLRNFFSGFMDIIGTAEGSLSGLQKGIQGVTEETAQIIEALLNSMRYYVADSNLQLRNIYMILSGNEAMPNPILAELRAQTEQIRAINRLIRNVTASGHPNGGDGIKVFMN